MLDKAIYHLWETINDLEQIQPERVEHYRVSIFGSSRIRRGDPITVEAGSAGFSITRDGVGIDRLELEPQLRLVELDAAVGNAGVLERQKITP